MMNVFHAWREQRHIQSTRRQLHALSDHILADIGLTRDQIWQLGRKEMPHRGADL